MRTGADMHERVSKIDVGKPALDPGEMKPGRWAKRKPGGERWVKPAMVVEIEFTEWTPDGHVRDVGAQERSALRPYLHAVRTDRFADTA